MSTPSAQKIMVIRHAEKPTDDPEVYGVNIDGTQDDESLVPLGWQRAGALACLFAPSRGPLQAAELATPGEIWASGTGHHSHSLRPQETVTPLAQKLGITLNTQFMKSQEAEMAAAATEASGVVLICWEHQDIPTIANTILGDDTTAPQSWPGDRFDLVWVFDLDASTGAYGFTQVPQLLLQGDSATPISG